MAYRGNSRPHRPPHQQQRFQSRGGGNQHLMQQPRLINSVPWQQNNVNAYQAPDDSLSSYQQAPMENYNYQHPSLPYSGMPSPDLNMGYPPQMGYIHPQIYPPPHDMNSPVYMSSQMVSTTPPPAPVVNSIGNKKIAYNSPEMLSTCSNCHQKNCMLEIDLQKKEQMLNNQRMEIEFLKSENLMLKEQLQRERVKNGLAGVNVVENIPQATILVPSIASQLSPEAVEFEPKRPEIAASDVPVVSAKGINDEAVFETRTVSTEYSHLEEHIKTEPPCTPPPPAESETPEPVMATLAQEVKKEETAMKEEEPAIKEESAEEHWDDNPESTPVDETIIQQETQPLPEPPSTQAPNIASDDWSAEPAQPPVADSILSSQTDDHNRSVDQQSGEQRPFYQSCDRQNRRGSDNRRQTNMPNRGGKNFNRGSGELGPHERSQQNMHSNKNASERGSYSGAYQRGQYNKNNQRYGDDSNQNWRPTDNSSFQGNTSEAKDSLPSNNVINGPPSTRRWEQTSNTFRGRSNRGEGDHRGEGSRNRDRQSDEPQHAYTGGRGGPPIRLRSSDETQQSYKGGRGGPPDRDSMSNETQKPLSVGRGGSIGHSSYEARLNDETQSSQSRHTGFTKRSDYGDGFRDQNNIGARGNNRRSQVKNIVQEIKGDLFTASTDFSLAHCVAKDFRMGSGIAVKFKTEFKRVGELLDQNVDVGGCAYLKDKESGRYVFYLVTKYVSSGKPTYDSLRNSLQDMQEKCVRFGVTKLALPRIGCGLDRLDWSRVRQEINEVFQDCDIEISCYDFNQEGVSEAEGNKPNPGGVGVKYNIMNLVDIEQGTGLVFLGTEDGHSDATATSLNSKLRFLTDYKKATKTVGKVWCFKSTHYYIYSLIVSKSCKDRFLFSVVEECCRDLAKLLRKDQFEYVGIEAFQEWSNDDTFTEKIVTLLRQTLPKPVRQLWVCFPDEKYDVHQMCQRTVSKQPHSLI